MAISTNSVQLLGRVSKYKEIKVFETGGMVCTIGLGVRRGEKWQIDKDGKPLTVSQVKITGTSFKRVQFNDELNEFEYVE